MKMNKWTAPALGILKEPRRRVPRLRLNDLRLRLLQLKLSRFRPKVQFTIDVGQFLVKTAETVDELRKVLSLRHEVFIREGLGEERIGGIDFDRYDLLGDHILLIEKSSGEVIGTYRLMCSRFTEQFYSETEFTLEKFLGIPGVKLELGRACIHSQHRSGSAIHLVWKGLGCYAALVEADFMFGCTSLYTVDPQEASAVINQFKPQHYSDEFGIRPRSGYRFPQGQPQNSLCDVPEGVVKDLTPSLLSSYIRAGARVFGEPALDQDFRCTDLLTILRMRDLPQKYVDKYLQTPG